MRSDALLTKINIGSPSFDGVPGGVADLSREDIAAALGMGNLPEPQYYFGLLLYMQDKSVEQKVANYLYQEAVAMSVDNRWSHAPRGKPYLRGMARTALYEVLNPNHCKLCKGDGERPLGVTPSKESDVPAHCCPSCRGYGSKAMTETQRALKSGIPKSSWRDTWGSRYSPILSLVLMWLCDVQWHVIKHAGK